MADFSKRIALLALAAAAGCTDSFPPVPGPLDRFYYPVGLAARRLPAGNTALLVVSSNFDLRFSYDIGGAVLAVDPDRSGDARPVAEGGSGDSRLEVLGGLNIGSFGGLVAYLGGAAEYPEGQCLPLEAADPLVAAGGARVVTASRGRQEVYRLDMDRLGALSCDGCAVATATQALDPYGVGMTCAQQGGKSSLAAWVTHQRAPDNLAWMTQVDLVARPPVAVSRLLGQVVPGPYGLVHSQLLGGTYTATPAGNRLFVTTRIAAVGSAPLRWLDLFTPQPVVEDMLVVSGTHDVGADVKGALTREFALSADGSRGYLLVELYDYELAARTGSVVETGGALAIYDMTPTPFGDPGMQLLKVVPTCLGVGQLRALRRDQPTPPRSAMRDLVVLTCQDAGSLLLYDDELGVMAARVALDPASGRPRLGRLPFGMAVEERASGCKNFSGACTRLYVASFDRSWVNLLELDKWAPQTVDVVKRIGRERE